VRLVGAAGGGCRFDTRLGVPPCLPTWDGMPDPMGVSDFLRGKMRASTRLSGGAPMPEQLEIEPLEREAGFRVAGELDLLTVPQLREALAGVGDQDRDLVLDFTAVSFVDSSGLGLLLSTARTTEERGRALVVRGPSPTLRRLLGIAIPDRVPGLVVAPALPSRCGRRGARRSPPPSRRSCRTTSPSRC